MTQKCPKCQPKSWEKQRVYYKRKLIKGRPYWITHCIKCRTPLDLDTTNEKE